MPIDLNSWKESADRKPGELNVLTINGVEFRMRWVPAGTFVMGGSASDHGSHNVTLTRGFWLMETEATQEMWTAVMGSNPSAFEGAKNPVDSVTWAEAREFAEKLTSLADGLTFALPTEAQWEYACRAGSTTQSSFGDVLTSAQCNCSGDYPYGTDEKGPTVGKTTPVGSYPANAWGFFDMHGNVWEWTQDVYGPYPTEPQTDPAGPEKGTRRVLRGGSWNDGAGSCRSAYRGSSVGPEGLVRRYAYNGVRLALTAK